MIFPSPCKSLIQKFLRKANTGNNFQPAQPKELISGALEVKIPLSSSVLNAIISNNVPTILGRLVLMQKGNSGVCFCKRHVSMKSTWFQEKHGLFKTYGEKLQYPQSIKTSQMVVLSVNTRFHNSFFFLFPPGSTQFQYKTHVVQHFERSQPFRLKKFNFWNSTGLISVIFPTLVRNKRDVARDTSFVNSNSGARILAQQLLIPGNHSFTLFSCFLVKFSQKRENVEHAEPFMKDVMDITEKSQLLNPCINKPW